MDETLLAVKVTVLSLLPYQTKETSSSSFEHLVSASTVHSRGAHDSNVAAQTNRKLLISEPHNNLLHFHHKASCCANQVRSRCQVRIQTQAQFVKSFSL